MEEGGLGADGLAFWDLHNGEMVLVSSWISTMVKWCLSPHYGEMVFVYSSISTYWEIACEIGYQTGARSGNLNGDLLGFFNLFSGISNCSGDLELDSVGFLSISIVREIDETIAVSIGRSEVLL